MEEPVWLDRKIVEAIHADQIRRHGGAFGLRDPEALESALARPVHRWSYEEDSDLATLAAAYCFGIARNHPFVDGNKRMAFLSAYVFLGLNGWEVEVDEAELVLVILETAAGERDEGDLARWFRGRMAPR